MSEIIYSKSLSDGAKVFVKARYAGENDVPNEYDVTYQAMRGDGTKSQETFPPESKFSAIAYAKGFAKAQSLNW